MNLREQQARQTYERIILAAEQLVENTSFEKLSVEQICEYAEISKGGFYHHFPSKDQLISLLIGRQLGTAVTSQLEKHLQKGTALDLLKIYVDTMAEYLENSPANTLVRCWSALADHSDMLQESLTKSTFQLLDDIIKRGIKEGSIRQDLDEEFCQSYVNGVVTGIMIYGSIFKGEQPLKRFAAQSWELILSTLTVQK